MLRVAHMLAASVAAPAPPPSSVTLAASINGGVLPGGVSQPAYNTWAYTFTAPALPAGYVAGRRQFFVMTGTRDSNGAVRNNRDTDTLVQLNLVNSANSINTTLARTAMTVEVDGHSDFNSAVIGHIPADAVGSTTITVTRSYSAAGGSDFYMLILEIIMFPLGIPSPATSASRPGAGAFIQAFRELMVLSSARWFV